MKQKLFSVFFAMALLLPVSTQAQLLDAVNDSPEGGYVFDENGKVSGRNNAPMATTNWTFKWSNYELDSQDELGGQGGGYKLWGCEFTKGNNSSGTYPAFDIYLGYTTALNYGRITFPPTGNYTMLTSASSLSQINGRVFSNSNFQTAYCTSSTNCGQFKVGNINLAAGRHGYPYLTTTSNFGTSSSASTKYNITIGDSRAFSETYTTVRVATDEENGKGVLWATNNTNTITLVFDLSSFDANIGIPAGTYTIGTNVRGGAFDEDGYTRWNFTSGSVTISKSGSSLSLSTSSLKGVSSGSTFNLSCTISSKTPNKTFTPIMCDAGLIGGSSDSPYWPFKIIGQNENNDNPYFYMPYAYLSDIEAGVSAFWTSVDATNNKLVQNGSTVTTWKQGFAVVDYTEAFEVMELTTGIMGNNGTFYYVYISSNQVSNASGTSGFSLQYDQSSAFSATFSGCAIDEENSDESLKWISGTGEANNKVTNLAFWVDDTKDGVVPSGRYPVRSTCVPNTLLLGCVTSGGDINGSFSSNSGYSNIWAMRTGGIEVVNVNETYYISTYSLKNSKNYDMTFTMGTAPKDITLTTPAANGAAQIQFTATNWGNKVLTYASGTAHKFFQGQTLSLQATPASGYRVAYWTLGGVKINGSELQNTYSYTVGAAATQTLAAVLEQASTNFHLAWDANGGVLVDNAVYSYAVEGDYPGGEELPDGAPNATREGYQLTGWYDAEHDLTWTDDDWTMPNHDVTYTAQWTANTHNVSWVTDGNALTGTYTNGTTAYGTTIVAPETPTKTATAQYTYTFNGWTPAVAATMPDNDVTYTATWTQTPVSYTLTWTTDGDALTGTYTSGTVAYGTAIVAPATPTKTGYTFAGWDVTPASTMPAANTTYTAQWTANTYQVSFDAGEGSGAAMANQNFSYGVAQNLSANTYTGPAATITYDYQGATGGNSPASHTVNATFDGWTDGVKDYADEAEVINLTATNNDVVELTAVWWWAESIILPSPTKTGYTFYKWTGVINGMNLLEDAGTEFYPDESGTLTAQWDIVTYNLTYNGLEGATHSNPATYNIETATFALADPGAREGYTFTGWTCGGSPITQIAVGSTGDKTITANWSLNTYTVSVVSSNVEYGTVDVASVASVPYGTTITTSTNTINVNGTTVTATPAAATAEYTYAFTDWTNGTATVTGNLTVTANFSRTANSYTLSWVTDGDALTGDYTHGTVAYGTAIVAPATPTKTGYTFNGWTPDVAETMPAENTTYTATWTQDVVNITLYENKVDEFGKVDNAYYTALRAYHGSTANVTYSREFTEAGRWSTLTLPFAVTPNLERTNKLWGCVYEFKRAEGMADVGEGLTLYFSRATSMEAGKCYIINPSAALVERSQKGAFVFGNVEMDLSADRVDDLTQTDAYDGLNYYGSGDIVLVGTLRNGTLTSSTPKKYMGLKQNKIYYTNSTAVRAYRGVFRFINNIPSIAPRVRIVVDGEDMGELEVVDGELTTPVETRKFIRDGVLYIERDGVIYDAQGKRAN